MDPGWTCEWTSLWLIRKKKKIYRKVKISERKRKRKSFEGFLVYSPYIAVRFTSGNAS